MIVKIRIMSHKTKETYYRDKRDLLYDEDPN